MAQNIIALYRSLHQRILQLQQQEQTLSGQLAALESSAKSAAVALQPTYQQELATAMQLRYSPGDVHMLFDLLGVEKPNGF